MSATSILSISCGWPDCERAFGSEAARATHRKYTHGEGQGDPLGFPCRVSTCSASFGTASNRDEHMREAHKGPATPTSATVPTSVASRAEVRKPKGLLAGDPERDAPKPFVCTERDCGRSFERASQLGTHRFSKHGIRSATRTPARTGRVADPDPEPSEAAGVVTIVLAPTIARLLLAAVEELGDRVNLDFTDPASLRREADRLELEQTVKRATEGAVT